MNISKAVITAGVPRQSTLPLQDFVDRHGQTRTALELTISEAVDAGIEEVCIVICPGTQESYSKAAGSHAGKLHFVVQDEPRGYGDAICQAKDFIGNDPFLHLVSDHLYLSYEERGCAQQLVAMAKAESCAVSAVQATRENKLPYFGTLGARRVPNRVDLYEITKVVEKPTPTQAEQELIVAGLRSGFYLCLFGMHVLSPDVLPILEELIANRAREGGGRAVQLSDALSQLAQRERYLALQVAGARHDIGVQYGALYAQLALALSGDDRDQIKTELIELLTSGRESPANSSQGNSDPQ